MPPFPWCQVRKTSSLSSSPLSTDSRTAGKFDIVGEDHLIPIVGASTGNLDRVTGVSMRAVVAGVLGEPGEDVAPLRSQRDVSLAWHQLVQLIGTKGCASRALSPALEMSRRFPVDPLIEAKEEGNSLGHFCTNSTLRAGLGVRGYPKLKSWPSAGTWDATFPQMLVWMGWYNIGQSGMLPETFSDVASATSWPPGFGSLHPGAPSLVVGTATPADRMGRALGMVDADVNLYVPQAELSLSYWLSGAAVVTASTTFGAALSLGLTWASINGLGLPHPSAVQATTGCVQELTAGRATILLT
ncbi:hypothetical protein HPB52_011185 [Rhipicephalus sanguineus]|uniref:Uncharacterized protein n=1 Tax=Rhipicephalus sanguineus TaxID=34632 RepID=A0A9D4Q9P1_RHISA|nr:hypothetical protein HPB52_011185 [Rhipicephalus sanguineus]